MTQLQDRRQFLETTLLGGAAAWAGPTWGAEPAGLKLASFKIDVTPPIGHPMCGGWIKPMVDCADPLEAIGIALLGAGAPIVIVAVDWTGILNRAHLQWREAIAKAAGTTPERVAVQCVHQHDAPFVCLHADALVTAQNAGLNVVDEVYFEQCLQKAAAAVAAAIPKARPVTQVKVGQARVEQVAGNRRLLLNKDGKVAKMRGSACKDPELIALPEGLIDPMLKTVAFYDGPQKIAACHYYASHPMSHYGQGHVSSDFVGLARKRRQHEEPGCMHLYFTGAAGNVAAGKFNDGSPEARVRLTDRIYEGMVKSEETMQPIALDQIAWKTHNVLPPTNVVWKKEELLERIANTKNAPANRIRPAMVLAWMQRVEDKLPIVLSALQLGKTSILHLPAESFVEYQLRAQSLFPDRFIATAAYGDGGPWYIPIKEEYPKGGYEVSVANCAPEVDDILTAGMKQILA